MGGDILYLIEEREHVCTMRKIATEILEELRPMSRPERRRHRRQHIDLIPDKWKPTRHHQSRADRRLYRSSQQVSAIIKLAQCLPLPPVVPAEPAQSACSTVQNGGVNLVRRMNGILGK